VQRGACRSDAVEIAEFSVLAQDTEHVSCEQPDHKKSDLVLWQELRLVIGKHAANVQSRHGATHLRLTLHQGHHHYGDHTEIRPGVRTKSFDSFGVFRRIIASSGSS
jgi:hypothetical protein